MRTHQEILTKLDEMKGFINFHFEVLVEYLPFDLVKPLLKPFGTPEKEAEVEALWKPKGQENILKDFSDYMVLAWDKIDNHRGLSASRSVDKAHAWVWLLEHDDFLRDLKETMYPSYGAPIIAKVCQKYGWPIPNEQTIHNMIEGMSCSVGCDMGCGT